jgi:hypothetical protein
VYVECVVILAAGDTELLSFAWPVPERPVPAAAGYPWLLLALCLVVFAWALLELRRRLA